MVPISADVNRLIVDRLADGDVRAIHTTHTLVKLVALLKADRALVQCVSLWKITLENKFFFTCSITNSRVMLIIFFRVTCCDNRPPRCKLWGVEPPGPFLGPLTSFPGV